jgi:predicted RNase H-like HicB family nuclease
LIIPGILKMYKAKFVYYQKNDFWVGWLEEYPDYHIQGETLDELKENLKDIYQDATAGQIPQVRRYRELAVE